MTKTSQPPPELAVLQRLDGFQIDILRKIHGYPTHYPAPLHISQLGLVIAEDRAQRTLWIGIDGDNVHLEDRWLYHSTQDSDEWVALGRPHPGIWDSVMAGDIGTDHGVKELHAGVTQTIRTLSRSNLRASPTRSSTWLLTHYQVFGHLDPKLIALLPERVNWVQVHEILHHTAAWAAENGAEDMPSDLLLRMHGLGALLDLPEDMPLDPTVARLLYRRVQKMPYPRG
jgi:hypothetical protein